MEYHFILTNGRSGSNYLVNTLNLHPEITNYGEVLGNWTLPYKVYEKLFNKHMSIDDYLDHIYNNSFFFNVAQFYSVIGKIKKQEKINIKAIKNIKSLGIKEFYINLEKHHIKNYLIENKNIKIINLYRENQLRRLISCLFLNKTGVVANKRVKNGKPSQIKNKIVLPIDDLLPTLNTYEQEVMGQFEIINRISPKRALNIKYEDYFQCPESINEYNQLIYRFLGVSSFMLKSSHQKILSSRWEDNVENYKEVYQTLENTEYAKYFS